MPKALIKPLGIKSLDFFSGYIEEQAKMNIKEGYIPGSIGRIAELHGTYYSDNWGFGLFFEAKVAGELSEFLGRYDKGRDRFLTAWTEDSLEGSIAIDGIHADTEGAHLRWFIVSERLRGTGAGGLLINNAIHFCRKRGYKRIFLWTFEGLDAARHLYEKEGFRLVDQKEGAQWGTEVKEQRFLLRLDRMN